MHQVFAAKHADGPRAAGKKPKAALYMPKELACKLYSLWVASNYVALPYPGALMQQPYWVIRDFEALAEVDDYYAREADRRHRK